MFHEHFYSPDAIPCCTLTVQEIYRVKADHTYHPNHPAEEHAKKIFLYTDRGHGQLLCGSGEFYLKPQTALIFCTDAPFSYWPAEGKWDFWWFAFRGDISCPIGHLFQVHESILIEQLCQKAAMSLYTDSSSSAAYLSCMISLIANTPEKPMDSREVLFCEAQELIKKNLYHVNISSVAEQLSISTRTLNSLFHQYAGCSPKSYMQDYVMEKGKYLLKNTTKSILEISDEMGYTNQFHFSRCFRLKFGISPSQYRKLYRESADIRFHPLLF